MDAEWLRQDEPGGVIMAFADRVKTLRAERGWSQTDLAGKIGAAPAQISRYESGRTAPSADTVIRLAEVFDVSCDYLLVDQAARRPFRSAEDILGDRLASVAELDGDDRALVLSFIDALVTKTRLKRLTAGIS
jgi:transcriptional regulator with XRE-family HTH domain